MILAKFPSVLKHKLIRDSKSNPRCEKLETFLNKFKQWSKQALDLEKYEPEFRSTPEKAAMTVQILSDPQANVFLPSRPFPSSSRRSTQAKAGGVVFTIFSPSATVLASFT